MFRAPVGVLALCAVALATTRSPAVSADNLSLVGGSAPAFMLNTLDGDSITSDFHGRPAYINVFATWCPPCQRELPGILEQATLYHDRITFLFIDEQEPSTRVKSFARGFGVPMRVAVDRGQFAAAFDVQGLPESIFIDRHGIVRYVYRGTIPDGILSDQLAKLAADSSTSVAAR